jgi:hypothetical protein
MATLATRPGPGGGMRTRRVMMFGVIVLIFAAFALYWGEILLITACLLRIDCI